MRDRPPRALLVAGLTIVCSACLASCDSSSSGSNGIAGVRATTSDEAPAGIYTGTITFDGAPPTTYLASGIISENLDTEIPVFVSSQLHYAGQVSVSGTALSGTLTEYRGAFRRFSGLDGVSSVDIDGSVSTADSLSASFTTQGGSAQIELNYRASYEEGSSLDLTAGVWSFGEAFLGGGAYTVTLDIDADGKLFGSDSDGCVFSGGVSIIDYRYNVYRAVVRIDNCGNFDGDYSGLGFLSDFGGGRRNQLTLSVSNDVYAFVSVFNKT